jgi:hypothetical protein
MAYTDYDGMRGLGASGSYGTIPEDVYLRKIESSAVYEDPNAVDDHFRSTLVDWKPDKPFFASDLPRSSNDPGGGFGSVERLNLRHSGGRSTEDPYLPDGTFLDWEFAERDPRGTATGPDMRRHYDQQIARASLIKVYNDNDYSVPEQGINPARMVANIKSGMYQFKDRYANFEESQDAWHNGGTGLNKVRGLNGESDVAKYTMDGTVMDLADSTQRNRADAVAVLSADPTIAFRHSTPDHRFKISRYGPVRASQFLKENDWTNNRLSAFMDHNSSVVIDGYRVNKQLANLIIDLQSGRETRQEVAKGAHYDDSRSAANRSSRLAADDVYKLMMMGVQTSQAPAANVAMEGQRVHRSAAVRRADSTAAREGTQYNHVVLDSMQQATRTGETKKKSDLRAAIEQAAVVPELMTENAPRHTADARNRKSISRESLALHPVEESKSIANYAGVKPIQKPTNDMLAFEEYGSSSLDTQQRRGNRSKRISNDTTRNEGDTDQGALDFGVYTAARGSDPGQKREAAVRMNTEADFEYAFMNKM